MFSGFLCFFGGDFVKWPPSITLKGCLVLLSRKDVLEGEKIWALDKLHSGINYSTVGL